MSCKDRQEREDGEKSKETGNACLQGGDGPGKETGRLGEKAGFLRERTDLGFYT